METEMIYRLGYQVVHTHVLSTKLKCMGDLMTYMDVYMVKNILLPGNECIHVINKMNTVSFMHTVHLNLEA